MVKNAVVPLRIPSILEVAPSEANAKSENGNALLTTAMIRMLGKYDLNFSFKSDIFFKNFFVSFCNY